VKLAAIPVLTAATVLTAAAILSRPAAGAGSLAWQVHYPRWSPDGRTLAYVVTQVPATAAAAASPFANPRWRSRVWLVNEDGTHAHPITPRQFAVENLAWSPDGSALAYAAGGHLWRYDLSSGKLTQLTFGRYDFSWSPAWSPNGTMIAYTRGNRFSETIAVVAASGGTPRQVMTGHERPAWSPDGTRLLVQRPAAFVNLDGSGLAVANAGGCDPRGWSADGTLLFGVQQTALPTGLHLCAFDTATGQQIAGWDASTRISPTSPTLSADNRVFAFTGGFSGRVLLLSRQGALHLLPGSDSASEGPSWSRKGLVAYIARSSCGRHSAIRVADESGKHARTLVNGCA
jgi:Tol biopolymer transport system component